MNAATYIGFETSGILGALTATIALIMPSVIVVIIVAKVLSRFSSSKTVQHLFRGLRPVATGLVAAAGFSVFKLATYLKLTLNPLSLQFNIASVIIFALMMVAMNIKYTKKLHPLVFIIIGGAAGAFLQL